MSWKEEFMTYISQEKGNTTPSRAAGKAQDWQEAEDRSEGKACPGASAEEGRVRAWGSVD